MASTTLRRPLVLAGPSGAGKSTLLKRLMGEHPGHFGFSVSHTTRAPRVGEEDGVHYHFVTREQMEADIQQGLFLEHATVHRNLYGTSFRSIRSVLASGRVCVLDIDLAGCASLKEAAPTLGILPLFVFVKPPSIDTLRARLQGRGDCTSDVLEIRLETASKEMGFLEENPAFFDAVIENNDIETSYRAFYKELLKAGIVDTPSQADTSTGDAAANA